MTSVTEEECCHAKWDFSPGDIGREEECPGTWTLIPGEEFRDDFSLMESLEESREESREEFKNEVSRWRWNKDIVNCMNNAIGSENIEEYRMCIKVDIDAL